MFKCSTFLVHSKYFFIFFSGWTQIISGLRGWWRDYPLSQGVFKDITRGGGGVKSLFIVPMVVRAAAGGGYGWQPMRRRPYSKTPKNPTWQPEVYPPPPEKKIVFDSGPVALSRYITPTLRVFDYLCCMNNLKDLIVKRGRLINNAPDGISGIQRAVQMKKEIRRESKIQMMAEAVSRGDMMSDMNKVISYR